MPLIPFHKMMDHAHRGRYAVGYFESWNLESLLAVVDAAEVLRSPIILGFSGIYLPHADRVARDPLAVYAAMGLQTCRQLSVPACLLFNESANRHWVMDAIDAGFNLVMFTDERMPPEEQAATVRQVVARAHGVGCAVEAEMIALPGLGGYLRERPLDLRLTDPDQARAFVNQTGVDALAVNVGQLHLHGRQQVRLDLDRLDQLCRALNVPLVLHGASSIHADDIAAAIRRGVRKINVGSVLKQTYYNALRTACTRTSADANPYEVIGSGLAPDVLMAGRLAMQEKVEEYMHLFGSAGRA